MSVVARMQVNEVSLLGHSTRVKLGAVYVQDENDPHVEEIRKFFAATPSGSFEAYINNDAAAEQFQPGDHFYLSLERVTDHANVFTANRGG